MFAVRADAREFEELPFDALPEVRATYVLVEDAGSIVRAVKKHLGHRTIKQDEFGTLDAFGHAAMPFRS